MTLSKILNTIIGDVKLRVISNGSELIAPYDHDILSTTEAYDYVKRFRPSTFNVLHIKLEENYKDYGEYKPYIVITASRYGEQF